MEDKVRAATYARVSSKAQAEEDKVSIGEQVGEMESYCARRGYQVVKRYQDVGSGSTKRRPDFQRMLADARQGVFDVIVCWKSDRLSRGIYPAAALMEVMEAQQIRLESVTDTLDMKTFGIYAAVGKVEIDNFRERATLGKRGVAKRGNAPVGSLPYGYRIGEDGRPEIDPIEGPVAQRIFREYVHEDHGVYAIARGLTEDGVPLRKGSKWQTWSVSFIHRILSREVYKGIWWYGKERHMVTEDGRKRFPQPQETWIAVSSPPLVDETTWERAQAIKRARLSLSKRNTRSFYLLQHLMFCEECGLGFAVRTNNCNTVRNNGRIYQYQYSTPKRYYKCQGMHGHGLKCREHPFLKAGPVEDMIWSEVSRVLKHPDTILRGMEAQATGHSAEDLTKEVAKAERKVQEIQAGEDRAIRLYVSGKISEAQLDRQRKFITEHLEQAHARLDSLKSQQRTIQERESLGEAVLAWARDVQVGLDTLTQEERQQVLRLVVNRIGIDRDGNARITLAIPAPEFVSVESPLTLCWQQP